MTRRSKRLSTTTSSDGTPAPKKRLGYDGKMTELNQQEKSRDLIKQCLCKLEEGIWWRILPVEEKYDDISVGVGVDWGDMLP